MDPHSFSLLDPDPHIECRSGSRREKFEENIKNARKLVAIVSKFRSAQWGFTFEFEPSFLSFSTSKNSHKIICNKVGQVESGSALKSS